MAMKFTKIPANTFQQIQLNAGILVDSFVPSTGTIGNLLGATTGGINFTDTPEYVDFGEDIDNCPKNTMELKKVDNREVKMAGTFITVSPTVARKLAATADIDNSDQTHIIPRDTLKSTDFESIWWIGDYSDTNTGDNAGFCAVHLMNSLNTAGFQIQSTDKEKGQFAFEFTGHYSISNIDLVPYEVYIQGGSESAAGIELNKHQLSMTLGDADITLTANVQPSGTSITWSSGSSSVATVSNGTVHAAGAGNTIITASITVSGVTYNDTCTVIVAAQGA